MRVLILLSLILLAYGQTATTDQTFSVSQLDGVSNDEYTTLVRTFMKFKAAVTQLFRFGNTSDPIFFNQNLANVMVWYYTNATFIVRTNETVANLTGKAAIEGYYYNDAKNTYRGFVLYNQGDYVVKRGPLVNREQTLFLNTTQLEFAKVASPIGNVNIFLAGQYVMQWIQVDNSFQILSHQVQDDRIYLMQPLVESEFNYS